MASINFKFIYNVKRLHSSNKHIKIFQRFKKKIAINENLFFFYKRSETMQSFYCMFKARSKKYIKSMSIKPQTTCFDLF